MATGGLVITKGAQRIQPPAGAVSLIVDANGVPYILDENGSASALSTPADGSITTAKIADGAVTTAKLGDSQVTDAKLSSTILSNLNVSWSERMWQFARSLSTGLVKYEHRPLVSVAHDWYANNRVGTMAQVPTQTSSVRGGCVTATTSASATSSSLIFQGASSSRGVQVTNKKTDVPWFVGGRVRFASVASSVTQNVLGMAVQAGTDGVWFGQDGFSGSTTKLALSCNSNDYVVSAVDVNTTFADLILFFDGTTVKAYYSSDILTVTPTLAASQATLTNVPTTSGSATFQWYQGDGTSKTCDVAGLFSAFGEATG